MEEFLPLEFLLLLKNVKRNVDLDKKKNVKTVGLKNVEANPFIAEVYYYNINQNVDPDLGHQEQIIIKVRVDESMKVASLYVGAEKNETVNGVLTNIWQITNERYGNVFGIYFESLHCPFCGTSVECLELDQRLVKCSNCGEKCMKKELKKF